jgi:ABC-type multidrug transport system fused ATPase/permease subunit
LINKDIAFFDETKTGEILSRISSDTGVIQDGLSTNISMFFLSSIIIIATLAICCFISVTLTLITLGGIVPIIVCAVYYSKKVQVLAKVTQDEKAILGNIAEESIGNIRTVKAFSNERQEAESYKKTNEKVY